MDIVKYGMHLAKEGVKSYFQSTAENMKDLRESIKIVKDTISSESTDVREEFGKIKNGEYLRNIKEWFFSEADGLDYDDSSDFDPGYDTSATSHSSNVESMEDAPAVQTSVTPEAFANINGKQTAAMYKIAAKQADVSALSTAEITTTIRRSNETSVASMNEIKKAIGATNQKLDAILGAINETNKLIMKTPTIMSQTSSTSREISNPYTRSIYKDGVIDITKLMEAGKANSFGKDSISEISVILGMAKMMAQGGPSSLVHMGIESLLDAIKPGGVFGEKSIHQSIKSVDVIAGAFAESLISELSSTQAFQKIFGENITSFGGDKDYSKSVNNQYNTKPALFDGMTRTTIIDTIPSLLRMIHEDLSHEKTHVDNRGQIKSGAQKNYFKDVTKSAFDSSNLLSLETTSSYTSIAKGANVNISSGDITTAAKALSMVYVMELHRTGRHLRDSQLVNDGMMMANKVISILVKTTGKSEVFWSDVVLTLITQLQSNPVDAHNFVKSVNNNLSNMINAAETFAQTSIHANQASKLTLSDAVDVFKNEYISANPTAENPSNNNQKQTPKVVTPTVSKTNTNALSTPDYVRGIFGILNRGINVRVMNSDRPFRPYRIKAQMPENPTIESTSPKPKNDDNDKTDIGEGDTQTYLDKILNSVVPKSIRISMQTFAQHAQNGAENLGLMETDENGKKHFLPQNLRDSMSNILSPITDRVNKVGELLLGKKEEVQNEDGTTSTKRSNGIFQGVKNNVKDKLNNVKNSISDTVSSKIEDINYKRLQRNVANMDTSDDDSKNDQILAQQVFSMMETAMSDGDGSTADVSAIMEIIEKIKDSKLKSNIRRSVDKMLSKKSSGSSEGDDKLGGIGGKILSVMGKIFSPIRLVMNGLKTVVSKFFNFYKKSFKSGITHLYTGIKSIGQGLFGSKKDGEDGLLKKVLQKPFNALTKGLDKIKNIGSSFMKKMSGLFSKFKINSNGETTPSSTDAEGDEGQQKKGVMSKLGDKIRSTEFGKGFMQAFDEANEIRSRNKATASTKADWYTMDIFNILQGKGSVNTVFDKIIDKLESINQNVIKVDDSVEGFETTYKTEENSDDVNSQTQSITDNNPILSNTVPNLNQQTVHNAQGLTSGAATVAATTASSTATTATVAGGTAAKSAGKLAGGTAAVILALVEILAPIVLAMEGIQAIMDSVKGLLTAIVEPLEPVFETLGELLGPILETLGEMLEPVMTAVSGVIEVILPILTILEPLLKAIGPALDIISTTLVNVTKFVLTPIMEAVVSTIVPVLNVISGAVQVLLGVVQSIWGVLNYGLGQLIHGIGKLANSNTLQQFGTEMISSGKNNIESGTQSMKDGWHLLTHPSMIDDEEEKEEDIELVRGEYKPVESSGSALDGVVGSGDIYNTDSHNSSIINNYYGSGDQSSYGSYLNMGQRGCGPLALAENISRRTGSSVNPRTLASGMYSSGMYEPDRGTSVSNYIRASSAMGVNLTPGGVTHSSLRMASPNNPITLIGSGTGYGTRGGNNHFINAIGTTPYGQTIVSNPLTGKIGRVSTNGLIANTRLGLYGSGDEEENAMVEEATSEDSTTQATVDATTSENASSGDGDLYDSLGFSEETKSAVAKLANIASKILSIFDFGDNDEEEALNKAKAEATANRLTYVMGENAEAYEKIARANFEKEYPKQSGESDAEYEARWNDVRIKYLTEAVNAYDSVTAAKHGNGTITEEQMKTRSENLDSTSFLEKLDGVISGLNSESSSSYYGSSLNPYTATLGGQFASDQGVVLATQGYTPTIFKNNLTSSSSTESPLHEWFSNTCGDPVTSSTSWYDRYQSPTGTDGVGTSGSSHQGIDINTQHDSTGTVPIYPTCDGTVTVAQHSDSAGNYVAWVDKAGYRHRIMHMSKLPNVSVGEQIKGGQSLLGYIGSTGQSSGPHIHYDIYKDGGKGGRVNPFTYFKYIPPTSSGGATMYGNDITEQIYSYLVTSGMSGIGASGLMGCFRYESGYRSNNLEDSYQSNWGYPSGESGDQQYTQEVDSGAESERAFVSGRTSGSCGYGVAQFTSSSLKQDLYDKTVKQGKSISDLPTQLDAITAYLKTQKYNGQTLFNAINSSPTPTSANQKFLWRYEAGTSYNSDEAVAAAYPWMGMSGINDRHTEAENIYRLYGNNSYQAAIPTLGGIGGGAYSGSLSMPDTPYFNKHRNDFNGYKNKSGLKDVFMPAALASDLTFPEIALVLSTGIWEDGGRKLFGTKSLTNTTYDGNGQQAVGIMNWVDKSVAQKYPTMEGQLNYMKQSYFADNPTHSRAYIQSENYNGQKQGYRNATGWNFNLNPGDRYAPTLNSNTSQGLIEGMTHFMGNALVPGCRNSEDGIAKHAAVAISAYNWLGESGYASPNVQAPSISSQPQINNPSDASNLDYGQIQSSSNVSSQPTINSASDAKNFNYGQTTTKTDKKENKKTTDKLTVNNGFGSAIYGSGDVSIYRDYDIPEIDMNQLFGTQYSDNSYYQSQQPIIVQGYQTNQEYDTKLTQKRYETILNNTYNVRAKELESLVKEIRDLVKSKKSNESTSTNAVNVNQNNNNDLFSNKQIPNAITRLMRG